MEVTMDGIIPGVATKVIVVVMVVLMVATEGATIITSSMAMAAMVVATMVAMAIPGAMLSVAVTWRQGCFTLPTKASKPSPQLGACRK